MSHSITIVLMMMAATAGAATLDFDFTSSLVYAQPGLPVTLSGTLTNTGLTNAYLNGDTVTSMLPFDDTPFLLNVPPVLTPGGSVTAALLQILPGPGTPLGLYTGMFSITGGDTPAATDVLSVRSFGVQVVPEPATWMCTLGLAPLLLLRRWNKLRRSSGGR
jgi:hypothetical protein